MSDVARDRDGLPAGGEEGRLPRLLAWVLLLCPLVFFVATARVDLEGSDSAELVTAAHSLDVAHGTGYPLYICIGRIAVAASPLSPHHTMNLLSAILGWGALVLFALALREVTGRLLPAAIPFAVVALARPYWFVSTVAEVYALHHLLLAATIFFLFRWRRLGDFRHLALASYAAALDLSHHGSSVFLVPVFVLFVLIRFRFRPPIRETASLVLLVAIGLSVYAYLPIRLGTDGGRHGFDEWKTRIELGILESEGENPGIGDHVAYKLAGEGPRRKFTTDGAVLRENFDRLLPYLRRSLGAPLLAAAVLGFLLGFARGPRLPAFLLAGCFFAVAILSVLFRSFDWEDFLVPAALFAGAGAAMFLGLLTRFAGRYRAGRIAVHVMLAILLVWSGSEVLEATKGRSGFRHSASIAGWGRDLLALDFPERSRLCLPWGQASVLRYLQAVEGARPDLRVHSMGRKSFLAAADHWAGREPVFVESSSKEMRGRYDVEPFGSLLRVTPKESP